MRSWISRKKSRQSEVPRSLPPHPRVHLTPLPSLVSTAAQLPVRRARQDIPVNQGPYSCKVCSIWLQEFDNAPEDFTVKSDIILADILETSSRGCRICQAFVILDPKVVKHQSQVSTGDHAKATIRIEQGKSDSGEREYLWLTVGDEEYHTGIWSSGGKFSTFVCRDDHTYRTRIAVPLGNLPEEL